MSILSTRVLAQSRVRLIDAFPDTNLVVVAPVMVRDPHRQYLVIQGEFAVLNNLLLHTRLLLGKGSDERYFWTGGDIREDLGGILLHIHEIGPQKIPRLELSDRLLRRDLVVFANLCLAPIATLEVTTPSGTVIRGPTQLPVEDNGSVVVTAT